MVKICTTCNIKNFAKSYDYAFDTLLIKAAMSLTELSN
jgi:hypothetical protein